MGEAANTDWMLIWTAVGAIAACILAGSIFFVIRQVNQTRKSTNAQIAMGLFTELRNTETIRRLRSIYNLIPDDFKWGLPSKKQEDIDYVIDRLDTLGVLVAKGVVDRHIAIEAYGGPATLRSWYCLASYIREIQKERGYYAEYYENFVRLSIDYFKKPHRFSKAHIPIYFYYKSEESGKDIVLELEKEETKENKLYPRSLKEIKGDRKKKGQ